MNTLEENLLKEVYKYLLSLLLRRDHAVTTIRNLLTNIGEAQLAILGHHRKSMWELYQAGKRNS